MIDVEIKAVEMEIANLNLTLENIEVSKRKEASISIIQSKGIYKARFRNKVFEFAGI